MAEVMEAVGSFFYVLGRGDFTELGLEILRQDLALFGADLSQMDQIDFVADQNYGSIRVEIFFRLSNEIETIAIGY